MTAWLFGQEKPRLGAALPRNASHKAIAERMISCTTIVSTITQVLSSSMLANQANSLNLWP